MKREMQFLQFKGLFKAVISFFKATTVLHLSMINEGLGYIKGDTITVAFFC